ncbi:MAG: folylpolyglutamate synthase/dihydrofolate synthase family protein [Pontimonas sp.]
MADSPAEDRSAASAVAEALYARIGEAAPHRRLEATRRAVELLGDPQRMYGVIHIAGTNGKTSTARITESLLRAHGLRVGLMTSPHLHRLNERIMIDGEHIADRMLADNWADVEPVLQMVDAELLANSEPALSFYEALTVLTFACFADAPVDVAVIEVGMGGEWDATNVVVADVAVLTPIAMDHAEFLGDTIREIARTKAGIIKPASRVVSAHQSDDAMEEILRATELSEATLRVLGRDFYLMSVEQAVGGQVLSVSGIAGEYRSLTLPLFGEHQADNAAVAIAAVESFLGNGETPLGSEVVEDGILLSSSPGRLQVIDHQPTVIIDAAHNPHGAEALCRALMGSFAFPRLVCVVGILQEKDVIGIIEALDPVVDHFVVTQSQSDRAISVSDLADAVSAIAGPDRVDSRANVESALERAKEISGVDGGVIITGSITLIGEVRGGIEGG